MLHQKEEIERQILIYLIEDEVPTFDKDKARASLPTSLQPSVLQALAQPQPPGSQQPTQGLTLPIFSNASSKAHPSHPSSLVGGHHGNLSNQNGISVQDESCNSVNSFNVAPPTSKIGVDEQVHYEKSTSSTPKSLSQNASEQSEIHEEKKFKIIDLDCIRYSLQLTGFKYKDANLFCELLKQHYTDTQGLSQEGFLGKFKLARAAIKRSQLYSSIIEFATFNNYIRPKEKPRRKLIENFDMCMQILQKKYPLIILIGGTSGTGKSTLASILASRFQISTVLSTDSIRHIVRNFMDESEEPILFTSTYEAGKCLEEDPLTKEAKRTIQGYKTQCKLVQQRLEKVVAQYANRGEPMIIEGVHLTPRFMFGLMKKHPYVIPFTICIEKESKHRQRFAVRSKYMTLDKKKNKYIQYISNIRMIQGWFMEKSDECLIPKINNVNVDKSVNIIHRVVTTYIHKMIQEDTKQLNEKSLNALLLYQSYNKIVRPLINKLDINQEPNKQLLLQKFIDDLQKEETEKEKEKISSNNNIPSGNNPNAEMSQLGNQQQQQQQQLPQQQQEVAISGKSLLDGQSTDNSAPIGVLNSSDPSNVAHLSPVIKAMTGQNLVLDSISRNNSICSNKTNPNPKEDRTNNQTQPAVEEFREKALSSLSAKETQQSEELEQFKEKWQQPADQSSTKGDNSSQKISLASPHLVPVRKQSNQQEESLPIQTSLPRTSIDMINEISKFDLLSGITTKKDANSEENQDKISQNETGLLKQQQNQLINEEQKVLSLPEKLQRENKLESTDVSSNNEQPPRNSTIQLLKKKTGKKGKRRRLLGKEEERSNLVTIHSSHNGEGQSEADSLHIGEDNFEFAVEEDFDEEIDCPEERSNSIDDEDEEDQNNFANQSEDESSDDDKKLKVKQKTNAAGTTTAPGQEDEEEEEDEDEEEDGDDYEDEEGDEYENEDDTLSSKYIGNINIDSNQGSIITQEVPKDKVSFCNLPPEKFQEAHLTSEAANTLKDVLQSDDHIQISAAVSRRIFLSKSQILHSQNSEESKNDHFHTTTAISAADHHKKTKTRFGRHDRQHSFVKKQENGGASGVCHSASGILLAQTKSIPANLSGSYVLQMKKRSSKHKRISHENATNLGQIQHTENNVISDIRAKSCDQEILKGFKDTSAVVVDGEVFKGIAKPELDSPNSSNAKQTENEQEFAIKEAAQIVNEK